MVDKELLTSTKKRRENLSNSINDNSLVIIPNKSHSIRSNDVEYKFKSDPDFYYLTGFNEPDSICVLQKKNKKTSFILFVQENTKENEIWVGKRFGIDGAKKTFQANESFLISDFEKKIKEFAKGTDYIYYPVGKHAKLDQIINLIFQESRQKNRIGHKSPYSILDIRETLHRMRLVKDNYEINCMRRAAEISTNAHILAMSLTKPGMYEYELEALLEYSFRSQGACAPAYGSIVGSGKNACILHYVDNNKKIEPNDLILIDAGCEYKGYAADLTRTFPAKKKFSPAQKDIYDIVLKAQIETIKKVKKGVRFKDLFEKSVSVIVDGLKELKLLKGSKNEIIEKKLYKKFYMHNIGHWLGLDVHDAGPYMTKEGKSLELSPNVVITIEPGIYTPNDSSIPRHFRNIGIRIEDDVLVTIQGNEVLTQSMPKDIKTIEEIRGYIPY